MLNKILVIIAIFGFAGITACGPSCEDVCDDSKQCEGADQSTNCADECAEREDLVDASDCGTEYDAYLDCYGGLEDICAENARDDCISEALSMAGCVVEYCTTNPSDSNCD